MVAASNMTKQSIEGVPGRKAVEIFRTMLSIRKSEEALIEEYHPSDEMKCPVHFCVGQEGPPTAVCLNLRSDDFALTGHRSHGYLLAKGGSMKGLFAELYGKVTGSNSGMAGSMEICDESVNFYSGTILAGNLPIALGTAQSSQIRGDDRVTLAVFGDGGADEGVVYEVLNYAVLKQLPMIFVCENNQYSVYSHQDRRQGRPDITERARAFGIPSKRMQGNDVLSVYRATKRAVTKARKGGGPSFLELDTYRWCSHVGPENDDHFDYRSMAELAESQANCPIEELRKKLLDSGILDESEAAQIERSVLAEIEESFNFAKTSAFPDSNMLYRNIFAGFERDFGIPTIENSESRFDYQQSEVVPRPY
jgi:pyruvate dehydrogenase E1 component alpha subunit